MHSDGIPETIFEKKKINNSSQRTKNHKKNIFSESTELISPNTYQLVILVHEYDMNYSAEKEPNWENPAQLEN